MPFFSYLSIGNICYVLVTFLHLSLFLNLNMIFYSLFSLTFFLFLKAIKISDEIANEKLRT